jgi:hypothetical protein
MCRIEVEPESLADLGRKLTLAAVVAGDVHHVWSAAAMLPSLGDCGSERLAGAVAEFLLGWGYGCGFLHDDAKTLADLLSRAGTVYLDVEAAIAGGAR